MKLLVDDRWFGTSGIGRYAKEILQRAPTGSTIDVLSKSWALKNPLTPYLLGREINRKFPDLFWSPGFIPPFGSRSPYVVTVHDLIHLKHGSKLQIYYFNEVIRPLLKNAACILTVSEYSRNEILDWTGFLPEKVVSIYNAVSAGYATVGSKFEPGYQYLLYVGNKRKHKNLTRLFIAFSQADLPAEIKLVCTGEATRELLGLADSLGISDRLVFLGVVAENDLPSIYRGALALVLVSLHEGFGIPLIEGMACGVPVVTSNVSALPEISAGAAFMVDPRNIDEIASGLEKVVNDPVLRDELVHRGLIRSQAFNWDETASQVWKIFARVSQ